MKQIFQLLHCSPYSYYKFKKTTCFTGSFLLLCFAFLFQSPIYSQERIRPEIINYPKSVYNAEGQNWSITQDENRIFYFGNNKGLLIFNGEEWNLYTLPNQKIMRSVSADGKGKIYSGAFAEIGYWQKELDGNYQYHSLNKLVSDSLFKEEEIWKIIAQPDKVVFQSFSRIYILRNNRVKTIVAPATVMFLFPVNGRLYAGVLGKGIYMLDDNEQLVPVSSNPLLNNYKVTFILPYRNDQILIGTEKNGIYLFDGHNYYPFKTEHDGFFTANEINNAVQINDDLYAIGTISGGLVVMDAEGKFLNRIDKNTGLQNNTVLNILKDADGNCWLALDRGISQIVLNSNVQYCRDLQGTIGTVYSIAVYKNNIYVATNHGLYAAPFTSLSSFDENTLKRFGNIANQVWDLKVIDDKLFCSYNSGTTIITENNAPKLLMSSTGCWDMEMLPNNPNILVQGTYYGIAVYKKINGEWAFSNFMKGTENMAINKLRIDAKSGLLWVNHAYKGVFVIQPSDDFSKTIKIKKIDSAQHVPNAGTFSFFENEGTLFLNGKRGIYKYDFLKNDMSVVDTLRNSFGSYFYSQTIISDSSKGFWFINNNNVVAYKNNLTGEFQTFSFNPKVFELVTGAEHIIPFDAGKSFVSGEEGFAIIDKNHNSTSVSYRAPVVTGIQVSRNGRYFALDNSYFDGSDRIMLPHNQNGIVVHFSALSYVENAKYSYSFTTGNEPEWSEWTSASSKDFSNLSAGKYIFKIKSNISDDITTLYIYIESAWYWSNISKVIYILLLGLLFYFLLRWHRNRLAKQQLSLTKKMKQEITLQRQKSENEILLLKQSQLSDEVVHKSEDLAKLAMDLIKKKNVIKKLKQNLDIVKGEQSINDIHSQIQKLSKSLDKHLKDEENEWHLFENGFSKVHEEFFNRLLKQYPELTAQDLRLAAYLKMNLSTKEIAPLLNISTRGVEIKRYRLRKKIQLEEHENLNDFMVKF